MKKVKRQVPKWKKIHPTHATDKESIIKIRKLGHNVFLKRERLSKHIFPYPPREVQLKTLGILYETILRTLKGREKMQSSYRPQNPRNNTVISSPDFLLAPWIPKWVFMKSPS